MADESSSSSSSSSRDSRAACAACNYLRMRCNFDCPLARYFPANRASEVIWVDRHVGLARFVELVNQMRPELRDQMAESLISKAKARRRALVHAAAADIAQHLLAITEATKELKSVRQHLAQLRSQQSPTSSITNPHEMAIALAKGAFTNDQRIADVGIILFHSTAKCSLSCLVRTHSSLETELVAIIHAMQLGLQYGSTQLTVFSHCAEAVGIYNGEHEGPSELQRLVAVHRDSLSTNHHYKVSTCEEIYMSEVWCLANLAQQCGSSQRWESPIFPNVSQVTRMQDMD